MEGQLAKVRKLLVTLVIIFIAVRLIWILIEPIVIMAIPYLVAGVLLVTVIRIAIGRTTRL